MGLDQTAQFLGCGEGYTWRKHSRLQAYMTNLFHEKNPESRRVFNRERLYLSKEDILKLKNVIENDELPICEGGFFWGHQFQIEATKRYKKQDIEFCEWALANIENGKKIFYESCW